jgi:hypothetical protein
MAIDPPTGSTRDYLLAFGIAAVYVAAPAVHRPTHIGAARDLSRALVMLRARSPLHLESAYWVRDKSTAADLVKRVRGRFADAATPAGDIDATDAAVTGEIEQVARAANIILTTHENAIRRVRAVIERVGELAAAEADGRLKFFNRAYREYHADAVAHGDRPLMFMETVARVVRVTGMSWYRRQDYQRILEIMQDAANLPATHDKWRMAAELAEHQLKHNGYIVVHTIIDPEKFTVWCRERGLKLDADARGKFANWVASLQVKDTH